MYTSGTTGLPKGALHTHNTMIWAVITFSITGEWWKPVQPTESRPAADE